MKQIELTAESQKQTFSSQEFNLFMVSNFAGLKQMYLQAEEDVANENALALYRGWQEWHQLDNESKDFVRDYMQN